MTGRRRSDYDDPERMPAKERHAELPLFAPSSTDLGMQALEETAAKHEAMITMLVPIARELAEKAKGYGVTISDVRLTAIQRGLLPPDAEGRALSFLGAVLARAGLVPTERFRRSDIARAHGNLNRVATLPEYKDGAA